MDCKLNIPFKMKYIILLLLLAFVGSASAENLLRNSSFELEQSTSGGRSGNAFHRAPYALYSTDQARSGSTSVKMWQGTGTASASTPDNQGWMTRLYKLQPSTQYTFSLYAYGDYPVGSLNLSIGVRNSVDLESGGEDVAYTSPVIANQTWGRMSVTFTTHATYSHYQFSFVPQQSGYASNYTFVDDIQLEQAATASTYEEAVPVEIGADPDVAPVGYLWEEDETVSIPFELWNTAGGAITETVKYFIQDFRLNIVGEGSVEVSSSDALPTFTVPGPTGVCGPYKVTLWLDGKANTLEELTFGVVPVPSLTADGKFGAHLPPDAHHCDIARKLGITWNRTLSVGRFGRWEEVEKTEDVYTTWPTEFAVYETAGLNTLLILTPSTAANAPAFDVDGNGVPISSEYGKFVNAVTTAYASTADAYEIWNEPSGEGGLPLGGTHFNEGVYADMLEEGWTEIQSTDPTATVVGMVDYDGDYWDAVIAITGTDDFDIASAHHYQNLQLSHLTDVKDSKTAASLTDSWNTEAGQRNHSRYASMALEALTTGPSSGKAQQGWLASNGGTRRIVGSRFQNINLSFGYSQHSKFFYYDARHTSGPNYEYNYTIFELNSHAVKPVGFVIAGASKVLDTATGSGVIESIDASVEAWSYTDGSDAIVALRANDGRGYGVGNEVDGALADVTITASNVTVYDVFGEEIPSSPLVVGDTGVYIVGASQSIATLVAGISATVATDTTPPNVIIESFPTDADFSGAQRILWKGEDDRSVFVLQDDIYSTVTWDIEYRYKLEGVDGGWSSWGPEYWADYADGTGGIRFAVQARDEAGNISETAYWPPMGGSQQSRPPGMRGRALIGQ